VKISPTAREQLADLRRHYRRKDRPEAIQNLSKAIRLAAQQITEGKGRPYPGPYRELARPERAWIHAGRYWILYTTAKPNVILAVFYDTADIPRRL